MTWALVVLIVLFQLANVTYARADVPQDTVNAPPASLAGKRLTRHKVLHGDKLEDIARLYGVAVADLKSWNKISDAPLTKGQQLWIVRRAPTRKKARKSRSSNTWAHQTRRSTPSQKARRRFAQGAGRAVGDHNRGRLVHGEQIQPGLGYVVRNARESYGTSTTVNLLRRCVRKTRRSSPGMAPIVIGDISLKHGGPFRPHKSHQNGLDVDVGYVSKSTEHRGGYFSANGKNLDTYRSWKLIQCFAQDRETQMIFVDYDLQRRLYGVAKRVVGTKEADRLFQYPAGPNALTGLIRHSPGHVNHFHIRVRKPTRKSANKRRRPGRKG
jgi:murein endopeptidase